MVKMTSTVEFFAKEQSVVMMPLLVIHAGSDGVLSKSPYLLADRCWRVRPGSRRCPASSRKFGNPNSAQHEVFSLQMKNKLFNGVKNDCGL